MTRPMATLKVLALAALVLMGAAPALAAEPCAPAGIAIAEPPQPVSEVLVGRPALRYLPPQPKGIVYIFHGSGGSEAFSNRLHSRRLLSRLIAAGYGYVSAPSLDRTEVRRWDVSSLDPNVNRDVAYMLGVHRELVARAAITARTPVFTTGMSNGGAFANLFGAAAKAQGLPVVAVADYMGPFPLAMRAPGSNPRDLPPTLLILGQRDGLVDPAAATMTAAALVRGGARIERHLEPERRICADTFALLPGLSPAQRQELVSTDLPKLGIISPAGERTFRADAVTLDREALGALGAALTPLGAQARPVMEELLIAWGAHQMRSDYADRQVAFFDAALGAHTK